MSNYAKRLLVPPSFELISKKVQERWPHFKFERNKISVAKFKHCTEESFKEILAYILLHLRLRKWKHLKKIVFSFDSLLYKGSNATLRDIGFAMDKNFRELENFGFVFNHGNLLTTQGLEIFSSQIGRHLTNLKKLKLHFYWCSRLDQKEFKIIGSNIFPHLRTLIHLDLAWDESLIVNDKIFLTFVSQIVRYLPNLKHLRFGLRNCTRVTNQGLETMATILVSKKIYLESFWIMFTYVDFDDKQQKNKLEQILRSIPKVEILLHWFDGI